MHHAQRANSSRRYSCVYLSLKFRFFLLIPYLEAQRELWTAEYPALHGREGTPQLGTDLANVLNYVDRTPITFVDHPISGIPGQQQHAVWGIASCTPEVSDDLHQRDSSPFSVVSSAQADPQNADRVEQTLPPSRRQQSINSFFRNGAVRLHGNYSTASGHSVRIGSITTVMREPGASPLDPSVYMGERGILWFYLFPCPISGRGPIPRQWEIRYLPFPTPAGDFVLIRYNPSRRSPSPSPESRSIVVPSPPQPRAPPTTPKVVEPLTPSTVDNQHPILPTANPYSELVYPVTELTTTGDFVNIDYDNLCDYKKIQSLFSTLDKKVGSGMEGADNASLFQFPRKTAPLPRLDIAPPLLTFPTESDIDSSSDDSMEAILPVTSMKIPGVAELPTDSPFPPATDEFRVCHPLSQIANVSAPHPFGAPFDELEMGMTAMNIVKRPDGSWITGRDLREWFEEMHTSNTIDGTAIPQNIDPTPLVRQGVIFTHFNFREFDLASIGEALHPDFADTPLGGKLGSPAERFMDPSLQIYSMSTQAQFVTYVQYFMHCVRTIQREQMASDKNGFTPSEFFSFPTTAGVNGMFTLPPSHL